MSLGARLAADEVETAVAAGNVKPLACNHVTELPVKYAPSFYTTNLNSR